MSVLALSWALLILSVLNMMACLSRAVALAAARLLPVHAPQPATAAAAVAARGPDGTAPFISVHVATHNEPPALVIATIAALKRLDYPNCEVIVIDNNTDDPAMWQPVADHVAGLGPRFTFLHRQGVVGAKAGALNIALAHTDPRAQFVAIVDADYQVRPEFLALAMQHIRPADAFVQFPQHYRAGPGVDGVIADLADYFDTFSSAANRHRAPLLTGTLSVIRIDAIRAVGGWPTSSITEDAELGVRLWAAGWKGVFVDHVAGTGLLPVDLAGLRVQRRRWAAGNMQTLLRAIPRIAQGAPGSLAVALQLTAWMQFLAVPLLVLGVIAVLLAADLPGTANAPGTVRALLDAAALTAALTIITDLGLKFVRMASARAPAGFAVSLALAWTGSTAWLAALWRRRLPFHRTAKCAAGAVPARPPEPVAAMLALAVAAALAGHGQWLAGAALLLASGGLVTAPMLDRRLIRAHAHVHAHRHPGAQGG